MTPKLVALLIAALALATSSPVAPGAAAARAAAAPARDAPPPPPVPPLEVWTPSPEVARLAAYLQGLMAAWPHAAPSVPVVDFCAFARDLATVVLREPPAWERARLRDPDHSKTAVLLLTLAYWEGSRFAAYVDEDLCSDDAWRKSGEGRRLMHLGGDCDGVWTAAHGVKRVVASAHSSFQIHAGALWPDGESTTRENLGERQWAMHIALRIARASLKRHGSDEGTAADRMGTLADYTGEWDQPHHPAADVRLAWAQKQWRKHPFRAGP
jgi:hypothetical protein